MATIDDLRRVTNEPKGDSEYNDDVLLDVLESTDGSLPKAAAVVWRWKAAKSAELVDMVEGETSRKLSDLHDNALKMAAEFEKEADVPPIGTRQTTIGRITRA